MFGLIGVLVDGKIWKGNNILIVGFYDTHFTRDHSYHFSQSPFRGPPNNVASSVRQRYLRSAADTNDTLYTTLLNLLNTLYLANILSPLQNNKYKVKNSASFVEKIHSMSVNSDEILGLGQTSNLSRVEYI